MNEAKPNAEHQNVEPWLRGALQGVHGAVMPVFFSFQQVREDLERHTRELTAEQIWTPIGNTSIGFHMKHLAGSVDRLATYLAGSPLSEVQLNELQSENDGKADGALLLRAIHQSLAKAEQVLRSINEDLLYQPRFVGRHRLPTTVQGLLVHLAEHTQRHLGQIIILAQVAQLR